MGGIHVMLRNLWRVFVEYPRAQRGHRPCISTQRGGTKPDGGECGARSVRALHPGGGLTPGVKPASASLDVAGGLSVSCLHFAP